MHIHDQSGPRIITLQDTTPNCKHSSQWAPRGHLATQNHEQPFPPDFFGGKTSSVPINEKSDKKTKCPNSFTDAAHKGTKAPSWTAHKGDTQHKQTTNEIGLSLSSLQKNREGKAAQKNPLPDVRGEGKVGQLGTNSAEPQYTVSPLER